MAHSQAGRNDTGTLGYRRGRSLPDGDKETPVGVSRVPISQSVLSQLSHSSRPRRLQLRLPIAGVALVLLAGAWFAGGEVAFGWLLAVIIGGGYLASVAYNMYKGE